MELCFAMHTVKPGQKLLEICALKKGLSIPGMGE